MRVRELAVKALLPLATRVRKKATSLHQDLLLEKARRASFVPRPDDVFIVSYPKSGTTLLQMMLYQLTTDGEPDFPHVEAISPWFEPALLGGRGGLIEALPSPRFFKSHALRHQVPRSARVLYIARQVRDVAISSLQHYRLITGVDHELEPFLDRFLEDRFLFGSWFRHLESWWPHRHDDGVLFLLFEDVVADLEAAVRRVAKHCEITVDEARMPRILERCGLAYMKAHNEKFDPRRRRLLRTPAKSYIRQEFAGAGDGDWSARHEELLAEKLRDLRERVGWEPAS